MKGYRTYFFAAVFGGLTFLGQMGIVTNEEMTNLMNSLETVSLVLTAIFMRAGIKSDTGN